MEQWKIERIEAVLKGFGTQDGEYVDRPAEIRIVDEEDCFVCHIQNRKAEYITDEAEEIAKLIANAPQTKQQRDELLDFAQHFFTWHANNFGDFDEDTNGYLLNLANEAEQAIANATEDKIIDDADLCNRLAKGDPPEVKMKKRCKDCKWLYKCTHGHLFKTSNGEVVFLNSQTNIGKSVCPYYERKRWKFWRPK